MPATAVAVLAVLINLVVAALHQPPRQAWSPAQQLGADLHVICRAGMAPPQGQPMPGTPAEPASACPICQISPLCGTMPEPTLATPDLPALPAKVLRALIAAPAGLDLPNPRSRDPPLPG